MQYWRVVAIVVTFIWLLVFFAANAFKNPDISSPDYFTQANIAYAITIIGSLLLCFFPTQFYIYVVLCCFWGLVNIFDGSTVNGTLMYCLGCIFASRKGFLFKNVYVRVIAFLLPLIVALLLQIRLGAHVVVSSFLNLVFLAVFFSLSYILLRDTIKEHFYAQFQSEAEALKKDTESDKTERDIIISQSALQSFCVEFALSDDCMFVLEKALHGEKYVSIAQQINKSESSVKKTMSNIMKQADVHTRQELLEKIAEHQAKEMSVLERVNPDE